MKSRSNQGPSNNNGCISIITSLNDHIAARVIIKGVASKKYQREAQKKSLLKPPVTHELPIALALPHNRNPLKPCHKSTIKRKHAEVP
jgi:hypothetical protein